MEIETAIRKWSLCAEDAHLFRAYLATKITYEDALRQARAVGDLRHAIIDTSPPFNEGGESADTGSPTKPQLPTSPLSHEESPSIEHI